MKKRLAILAIGGLAAGLAIPALAADGLTVVSWGGAYQDSVRKAFFEPFMKEKGDPFGDTDEDMLGYAKVAGGTLYHCVGTVAMGDERFPLDPQLRVRGCENLRVIDASAMPKISSGNTNAPTIMIAEKGAEMVLADAKVAVAA